MSVLVQNLSGKPWNIDRTHILQAGEVAVLDEINWSELPDDLRGRANGIIALWPSITTADTTLLEFDYALVGSTYEVTHLGTAAPGTLTNSPTWQIKKFSYTILGGSNFVSSIQTFLNVDWDNHATL